MREQQTGETGICPADRGKIFEIQLRETRKKEMWVSSLKNNFEGRQGEDSQFINASGV